MSFKIFSFTKTVQLQRSPKAAFWLKKNRVSVLMIVPFMRVFIDIVRIAAQSNSHSVDSPRLTSHGAVQCLSFQVLKHAKNHVQPQKGTA